MRKGARAFWCDRAVGQGCYCMLTRLRTIDETNLEVVRLFSGGPHAHWTVLNHEQLWERKSHVFGLQECTLPLDMRCVFWFLSLPCLHGWPSNRWSEPEPPGLGRSSLLSMQSQRRDGEDEAHMWVHSFHSCGIKLGGWVMELDGQTLLLPCPQALFVSSLSIGHHALYVTLTEIHTDIRSQDSHHFSPLASEGPSSGLLHGAMLRGAMLARPIRPFLGSSLNFAPTSRRDFYSCKFWSLWPGQIKTQILQKIALYYYVKPKCTVEEKQQNHHHFANINTFSR